MPFLVIFKFWERKFSKIFFGGKFEITKKIQPRTFFIFTKTSNLQTTTFVILKDPKINFITHRITMKMKMQIQERDSKKVFTVFKSYVEEVINSLGLEIRFDEAFEYYVRVQFHHFREELIQNLNQLEKLLNEEELHTRNCKESLKVIQTQLQRIFNHWIMNQSEFIDAFYKRFWVCYSTFRTQCINQMDELEKILNAEEAKLNEIEKLKREREQIEKDMQLKKREKIEREMQFKETEVIEKETESFLKSS